ncbi:diadenylate cyclase [Granulicatella balaenopterae]|uniref:Diadenylate cyclase n=1 Tax=Granulicatella balaenopterae TaxID=137733 RepID=A0A1H9NRB0_9LACT|nr:diadenylate cyclase CdaA [Granulicatella balaenopterae]SER38442.1 diadenylate cyclase [Granulicatella balaenopterae]
MPSFKEAIMSWDTIRNVIDILVVWFLIYKLLEIIKGTKAVHLIRGILVIALTKLISYTLGLTTLDWIINLVIQWGVIASIIIFQPEIRRGLEHIGRTNLFSKKHHSVNQAERMIEELNTSVQYMAKRRIGALICIEKSNSLQEYIRTGIMIDSKISNQLVTNIFIPNTPLHDGATIIRDCKIVASSCYLPLSENMLIPKELGTRHRAAIGLSEVTDAVTIVISEETGDVSIAYKDQLQRQLSPEEFVTILSEHFVSDEEQSKKDIVFHSIVDFLKGGSKND